MNQPVILTVGCEGSGVIYKKEGKYVYSFVTNTHVLNGAKPDILLADGSKVPGEVVGSDVYSHISAVRISSEKVKDVLNLDSNSLTVGEMLLHGKPLSNTRICRAISELHKRNHSSLVENVTLQSGRRPKYFDDCSANRCCYQPW